MLCSISVSSMQKSRRHDRKAQSSPLHSNDSQHQRSVERRRSVVDEASDKATPVRLTRKYAEMIDGVDLKEANVGDELDLTPHEANVLVAEGWAERAPRNRRRSDETRSLAPEKPQSRQRPKR
jgi:hypothetical protein